MAKKDTPTESDVEMEPFEGLDVIAAGVEIPGVAAGLQAAVAVDPAEFRSGEEVFVVMRCHVGKIRHEPVEKGNLDGPQRRVHIFQVDAATILEDSSGVSEAISAQQARIQVAEAEAKGQFQFGITPDPDETDQAKRVRLWLGNLKRDQLRTLCDEYDIDYSARTPGADLVEALVEHAQQIEAKMEADVVDGAEQLVSGDGNKGDPADGD